MATTETLPAQHIDGRLFHQPGAQRTSPSSSSLFLSSSPPSLSPSPKPTSYTPPAEHHESIPFSSPPISPINSTPRLSTSTFQFSDTSSFQSSPMSSGLSLDQKFENADDLDFPNYDSLQSDTEAPEISTTTDTTESDSPLPTPNVADDTAIKQEPSRHVDYLSHDWREEDIWASWRHIVSQRKVYGEQSRLENASWRTWAKSKYHLRTISPETLNWLKESDVTWLYGPLTPAASRPITSDSSQQQSSQISKSSSFINKKPILKKRSVSEVMLQKSISTSSLVKQAAAAVQAQQGRNNPRSLNRVNSDFGYTSSIAPSNPPSRDEFDYFSSRTSSADIPSPVESTREKHIRFDEKVEQCIAVDGKDDEDDRGVEHDRPDSALSDSSSDEGLVMMKRQKRTGPAPKGKISRTNSSSGQMIETLPSTTLKYRTDSPDVTQEAQHHVFGKGWSMGRLSPSPSQETLRPSRPSRNFLLADDDEEDGEVDTSSSWSFGSSNPKSSLGAAASAEASSSRVPGPDFHDGFEGIEGMRRTESGMFMPYDEDEDDRVAEGLFGRVSETINTFRDIGHVIWNVGWRR